MKLFWETEFFAVSNITGKIERFEGIYVEGTSQSDALINARELGLDYLQITGNKFSKEELESITDPFMEDLSEEPKAILDEETDKEKVKGMESFQDFSSVLDLMGFDDFASWIENMDKQELIKLKHILSLGEKNEEQIKIINVYIKKYEEKDKEGE